MHWVDLILKFATESAEMEYLRAKQRGMTDPVVELGYWSDGEPVVISVREREQLATDLDDKSAAAAQALRNNREPGKPFPILVAGPEGLCVINRPSPE